MTRRAFLLGRTGKDIVENEAGAGAIEYGLLGALVGAALIPALTRLGKRTRRPLNCTRASMSRARRGMDLPNCVK